MPAASGGPQSIAEWLNRRTNGVPGSLQILSTSRLLNLLECLGEIGKGPATDDGLGVVENQVAGDFVAEQFGDHVAGGGEDGRAALDVVGVGGNDVDGLVTEEEKSGLLRALSPAPGES